jgi:predicted AlkP superfamily pyrophosphatase or phosphodiesterase
MVLRNVDSFAASIHNSIKARNLTDIVDVIFVSDHGMTNTSNTRIVYLDDVMGEGHVSQIVHEEGKLYLCYASHLKLS